MVTVLTNRLGDIFLIISIGLVLGEGRWLINWYATYIFCNPLATFLLIIARFTKSAQIPFSAWLPAAIAAPTPVSALVHSSTLVTAGVYLLIRHLTLISSVNVDSLIIVSGILTIVMARTRALNEKDIKKIIALSTLSQLGVIIVRVGAGCALIAFLHLVIHAFFKAIIFVSTGSYIHIRGGYQNLLKTGGHLLSRPMCSSRALVARFSLAAVPFSAAFFSKEPILELILWQRNRLLIFVIFLLGVSLTVAYRVRFFYMVILSFTKNEVSFMVSEDDQLVNTSLIILFIPAFTRGIFFSNFTFNKTFSFFYYSPYLKYFILLVLMLSVIFIYLFQIFRLSFFYLFQYSLFYMWRLPLFRSKLLVSKSIFTSDLFIWNNTWLVKRKQPFTRASLTRVSSLFYESKRFFTSLIIAPLFFLILIIAVYFIWL